MIGFLNNIKKLSPPVGTFLNTLATAIFLLCFMFPGKTAGQDMIFSQAYASPSFFNPSLAGAYDALYRISVQHRNQWNSVLDNPFKTYALSGDARLEIGRDRNRKDAFSLGANFLSDRVGKLDFSKTSISLVGAFHKNLSRQNTQFLSVGFSLGMNQQNINYENIRFHDQFDGTNSYNLPTDEPLPQNNFSYADVSIGLNYSYRSSSGLRLNAGGSILHLFAPNVSFYQNSQEPEYFGETDNKIHRNFIGHLSVETAISPEIWLSPRVITSFQGPHTQIYAGTGSKLLLNESYNSFLHFGIFTRVNNRLDNYKFRDLSFLLAFEIEGISLGLSYDLSMDDIKHYSQRQGIFEISLSIMGDYYNEHDLCPRF